MKKLSNRSARGSCVIWPCTFVLIFLAAQVCGQSQWYKGNTHAHTVLCGHADSSPEAVAKWYHDHGYHFLILSEHNIYIDPSEVDLPKAARSDFILIPGEEITGSRNVHSTAVNVPRLIDWKFDSERVSDIIRDHLERSNQAGGEHILNHPTYKYAVTAEDMKGVPELRIFELHNAHPNTIRHTLDVDEGYVTTEDMWDDMLTAGMTIYGVSSDDTHTLKEFHIEASNPGRGWVMVNSAELTPDSITESLKSGDFYATSGVILSRDKKMGGVVEVAVDVDATLAELHSPYVLGHRLEEAAPGFLIEFVGATGRVLDHVHGSKGSYEAGREDLYVRSRISYTRRFGDGYEQFFAWTQPAFTDDRAESGPAR